VTAVQAPMWIRVIVGVIGGAALVLCAVCFLAPEKPFGPDAYHTLTRVPIGLLGALSFGVGVSAIVAARRADAGVLRSVAMTMFLAAALMPMVIIYNIGAFDQVDTSGRNAFVLSGLVIVCLGLPLLLSLLVLRRLGPGSLMTQSQPLLGRVAQRNPDENESVLNPGQSPTDAFAEAPADDVP
jgi:hypothetical protein